MTRRLLIVAALLFITAGMRARLAAPESVRAAMPLSRFPLTIDAWRGRDVQMDSAVAASTGADDQLSRVYASPAGSVTLYVAYYASQRAGRAIHSPMNCLPGNGWEPVRSERIDIPTASHAAGVNEVLVRRGIDQQLVLYWYQTPSRITASEYWSKAFLVSDAFRSGRTDVALVRVTASVFPFDPSGEQTATSLARQFAGRALPAVTQTLF